MGLNVTQKLIAVHLMSGDLDVGREICLCIDHARMAIGNGLTSLTGGADELSQPQSR
jgi:hypothetical protein